MTRGQTDFDVTSPLLRCLDPTDFYKMSLQNHSCHVLSHVGKVQQRVQVLEVLRHA